MNFRSLPLYLLESQPPQRIPWIPDSLEASRVQICGLALSCVTVLDMGPEMPQLIQVLTWWRRGGVGYLHGAVTIKLDRKNPSGS